MHFYKSEMDVLCELGLIKEYNRDETMPQPSDMYVTTSATIEDLWKLWAIDVPITVNIYENYIGAFGLTFPEFVRKMMEGK